MNPPANTVKVESLRKGDRFTAAYGGNYTYVRLDGALSGVHHVVRVDGHETSFAGLASVTPGWHDKGWLQPKGI